MAEILMYVLGALGLIAMTVAYFRVTRSDRRYDAATVREIARLSAVARR